MLFNGECMLGSASVAAEGGVLLTGDSLLRCSGGGFAPIGAVLDVRPGAKITTVKD